MNPRDFERNFDPELRPDPMMAETVAYIVAGALILIIAVLGIAGAW